MPSDRESAMFLILNERIVMTFIAIYVFHTDNYYLNEKVLYT